MSDHSRPVAIVGAGPYGLSLAAHLRARGVRYRIFGEPMESWRKHMPPGMLLKSEPFASSIADPHGTHRLGRFYTETGRRPPRYGEPVPLETFSDYGMWFARQLVCNVEPMNVKRVSAQATAFELELADGERFLARGVVVAAGHLHFSHLPPELRTLPPEFLSHSCRYGDLAAHAGKRVAVVGAGQSALETAVLLARNGAVPTLVARTPELLWNPVPLNGTRPLRTRIRAPISGLGPGWRMRLYSDAPQAFLRLPEATRLRLVRTVLGPAGAWWLRDEFEREVAVRLNRHIAGARTDGDAVRLQLVSGAGSEELEVDHVVAATGYRVDVGRLTFLSPSLKASVQRVEGAPVLNRRMESTVPGLFFIGLAAAPSFGPVMRFVYGTGFASRTVTRAIYSSG